MLYLDANVILRYLLEDCEEFISKSKDIIENNDVYIRNEVLAEVVYVLEKTYKIPKKEIQITLHNLLKSVNIVVDNKNIINLALTLFENKNIDFVDALLCAYSRLNKEQIVSFDRKLNKCINQ